MRGSTWVEVADAAGMTEAKIIEGRLKAEDIPVVLEYDAVCTIYAITVDGMGAVRILVPPEWRERARAVLDQSFEEKDLDWNSGGPDRGSG